MPLLNTIASPYAEALLQITDQSGESELVAEQAKQLLDLWQQSPELRQSFVSPVIEPETKKAIVVALFQEQVTPSFLNLLKLLADRQRISILDSILERFLTLFREQRHIALASVVSATPLSDDQQQALRTKVQALAGTENVEFKLDVDPSLIGGLIIRYGSKVIDASLSGQVRRLGLALAKSG